MVESMQKGGTSSMDREPENLRKMREDAKRIFLASLKRVDPYEAVKRFVRLSGARLILGEEGKQNVVEMNLDSYENIWVIGGGKASAPMARALEEILGSRIKGGVVVVKYDFTEPFASLKIVEAGHPLPDRNGVEGTRSILSLLDGAGGKDLVFSVISGGGSALLPLPAPGVGLDEKQSLTGMLLNCGATIGEINTVRKHISGSKGGQMARAAFPATTVNLMLSDVVGDRLDVIASGPFVPDPSTFQDALAVLEKYRLAEVPGSILSHLEKGVRGEVEETPEPGDPVFERVSHLVIGSNILALESAEEEAKQLGYRTLLLSSMVEGETREVAHVHTAIAGEILRTGNPLPAPACVISGGETTVTLRGSGRGGRNQEFCLASALDLANLPPRVVVLSGGTDGNDGPTDAAGGIVDPLTCRRGEEEGLSATEYLGNNDSYPFLEKTGDLLVTGPTRTNVMDVRLVLVGRNPIEEG
jgi:glycerate 2-kinase